MAYASHCQATNLQFLDSEIIFRVTFSIGICTVFRIDSGLMDYSSRYIGRRGSIIHLATHTLCNERKVIMMGIIPLRTTCSNLHVRSSSSPSLNLAK